MNKNEIIQQQNELLKKKMNFQNKIMEANQSLNQLVENAQTPEQKALLASFLYLPEVFGFKKKQNEFISQNLNDNNNISNMTITLTQIEEKDNFKYDLDFSILEKDNLSLYKDFGCEDANLLKFPFFKLKNKTPNLSFELFNDDEAVKKNKQFRFYFKDLNLYRTLTFLKNLDKDFFILYSEDLEIRKSLNYHLGFSKDYRLFDYSYSYSSFDNHYPTSENFFDNFYSLIYNSFKEDKFDFVTSKDFYLDQDNHMKHITYSSKNFKEQPIFKVSFSFYSPKEDFFTSTLNDVKLLLMKTDVVVYINGYQEETLSKYNVVALPNDWIKENIYKYSIPSSDKQIIFKNQTYKNTDTNKKPSSEDLFFYRSGKYNYEVDEFVITNNYELSKTKRHPKIESVTNVLPLCNDNCSKDFIEIIRYLEESLWFDIFPLTPAVFSTQAFIFNKNPNFIYEDCSSFLARTLEIFKRKEEHGFFEKPLLDYKKTKFFALNEDTENHAFLIMFKEISEEEFEVRFLLIQHNHKLENKK